MEEILKQILEGQNTLLQRMGKLENEMATMTEEIKPLKIEVSDIKENISIIKGLQHESSGYVQALLHRSEELDAKFDGLLHNTVTKEFLSHLASKEDIAKLNAKFEVLNSRLFHQEAELYELKAVK